MKLFFYAELRADTTLRSGYALVHGASPSVQAPSHALTHRVKLIRAVLGEQPKWSFRFNLWRLVAAAKQQQDEQAMHGGLPRLGLRLYAEA